VRVVVRKARGAKRRQFVVRRCVARRIDIGTTTSVSGGGLLAAAGGRWRNGWRTARDVVRRKNVCNAAAVPGVKQRYASATTAVAAATAGWVVVVVVVVVGRVRSSVHVGVAYRVDVV
jgi:hypothetical protein